MPYISKQFRLGALIQPVGTGELNYKLTCAVLEYMDRNKLSYAVINDIVGALECCKAEFIRRVVGPYEDTKIKLNGDVY